MIMLGRAVMPIAKRNRHKYKYKYSEDLAEELGIDKFAVCELKKRLGIKTRYLDKESYRKIKRTAKAIIKSEGKVTLSTINDFMFYRKGD